MRAGINRAMTQTRTFATDKIYDQLNLTKTYIRNRMIIDKAIKGSVKPARIYAGEQPILLSRYSTNRQIKNPDNKWTIAPDKPVRGIKVKRAGSSVTVEDAFYMVLPNSNALGIVRRRIGEINPKTGKEKIKVLFGPDVDQALKSDKKGPSILSQMAPFGADRAVIEIAQFMNGVLKRQFPKE